MASDFRTLLYERYVSTFKGPDGEGQIVWWDHKYLPLLTDLGRGTPILEIGCGSGGLLAYLARRGFSHALGIDISAEQVDLAQRRGVRAQQANVLEYLPQHQAAFGAIVAVDVLEHLNRDELVALAPMLWQALTPGGRLLIQTANGAGLFSRQVMYGDLTHLTIFTPQSLAQLLRGEGFERMSFDETGPIPIRFRGRVDVAAWRVLKHLANAVRMIEAGKRQAIWTENFICRAFKPG